jgi:chemotaxis regulatin CheY-phosphate phosphatase CheZ
MTDIKATTPISEEDYEAIEKAVMETERGRWFLAEYARRNRNTDTETVMSALQRIEHVMELARQAPAAEKLRFDLVDMADAISRTRNEIAQIKPSSDQGGRFEEAANELDAIVTHTETATSEILETTEKIQEIIWTLREDGANAAQCDILDDHITAIYTACSFQDLTGQRISKVVNVLAYLERRITTMMEIWKSESKGDDAPQLVEEETTDKRPDAHLLNGPAQDGEGIDQAAVDSLFDDEPVDDAAAHAIEGRTDDEDEIVLIDVEDTPVLEEPSETKDNEQVAVFKEKASEPKTEDATLDTLENASSLATSELAKAEETQEKAFEDTAISETETNDQTEEPPSITSEEVPLRAADTEQEELLEDKDVSESTDEETLTGTKEETTAESDKNTSQEDIEDPTAHLTHEEKIALFS